MQHVEKQFAAQKAVNDISFNIPQGSIFGLLGPNGAGKTTLIRMITGIFYPDAGRIIFRGRPFEAERDILGIGYMPEERGLYKKMKVGEQALYLARLKGLSHNDAMDAIKQWFIRFDMQSWWNRKVDDLSKGMSQKLQFVTTVLHKPDLIILDEPFSGLDPVNANLIKDEIHRLAGEGATIIFSTHRMEQVEEICDRIILVNKGEKVLDGSVQQVKQDFKEHLFKVGYTGDLPEWQDDNMAKLVRSRAGEMIVKVSDNVSTTQLLQHLLSQRVEITSFNELLPSLNDIFIKQVHGTPSARQFTAA